MDNPKAHYCFFFAPADQFKVMMDGRHLEDAAVQESATKDLDDDGDSFDIEHEA